MKHKIKIAIIGDLNKIDTLFKENLNKIIQLINDQLRIIVRGKFGLSDIERAKGYLIGSLLLNNERTDDIAIWFAYQEVLNNGKTLSPQEKCQLIRKISNTEITNLAKKYFTNKNWYLSAIGPIKSISQKTINI